MPNEIPPLSRKFPVSRKNGPHKHDQGRHDQDRHDQGRHDGDSSPSGLADLLQRRQAGNGLSLTEEVVITQISDIYIATPEEVTRLITEDSISLTFDPDIHEGGANVLKLTGRPGLGALAEDVTSETHNISITVRLDTTDSVKDWIELEGEGAGASETMMFYPATAGRPLEVQMGRNITFPDGVTTFTYTIAPQVPASGVDAEMAIHLDTESNILYVKLPVTGRVDYRQIQDLIHGYMADSTANIAAAERVIVNVRGAGVGATWGTRDDWTANNFGEVTATYSAAGGFVVSADMVATMDDVADAIVGQVPGTDPDGDDGALTYSQVLKAGETSYGTLTMATDGSYSYALDNSNAAVTALAGGGALSPPPTVSR